MKLVRSLTLSFALLAIGTFGANAVMITSFADPALIGSTDVDFDDETPGNFVSKLIDGVTFSVGPGGGTLRIAGFSEGGVFGGSGLDLSTRDTIGPSSLNIDFNGAVSAFAMTWGAGNPSWTMKVFAAGNVLLETLTIPSGPPFEIVAGAANTDITRVELTSDSGYDWVKIDNFVLVRDSNNVPDSSSSVFLISLGLLGLAVFKRAALRS